MDAPNAKSDRHALQPLDRAAAQPLHRASNLAAARDDTDAGTRLTSLDWAQIAADLDDTGHAVVTDLLSRDECEALAALYVEQARFRSRVVMARHGYGRGEYQYFAYPLPGLIADLRGAFYARLADIANRWNEAMRMNVRYPPTHAQFLERCHAAGQQRPTPLLLRYETGDYNCLHQDLYGEQVFPLQIAILLSRPGEEFTGGEFVLTEQRPRMQSRVQVVPLRQGDAVIFAVNQRPVRGSRGVYRVKMRHGVSVLRAGARMTAGVILHDSR